MCINVCESKKCIHSHKISFIGDREPRQYHDYAIGWITKKSRFNFLAGERNFLFSKISRPVLGTSSVPFSFSEIIKLKECGMLEENFEKKKKKVFHNLIEYIPLLYNI